MTTPPVELVVLVVGIGCLLLGALGMWWVWARPALDDQADRITALELDLADVEQERDDALHDRDEARDDRDKAEAKLAKIREQLVAANARAEGAETALGHQLLTDAGVPSLDAARAARGRA